MRRPPGGASQSNYPPTRRSASAACSTAGGLLVEGLKVTSDDAGQIRIAGQVTDQAALHGLLAKIRDLGLPLLSVRHIDPYQ